MHYGLCNAHCTMIYIIMHVVNGLYVEECPLVSSIPRFEGTTKGGSLKISDCTTPKDIPLCIDR